MMRMRSSGEYSSTIRLRAGSAFAHGGHQTPVNTSMTIPTISVAEGPLWGFAATTSGTSARLFDSDSSLTWRPESTRTVTVQDPSEAVHVAVSGAVSPGWSPGTEIGLLIASPEGLETLMRT